MGLAIATWAAVTAALAGVAPAPSDTAAAVPAPVGACVAPAGTPSAGTPSAGAPSAGARSHDASPTDVAPTTLADVLATVRLHGGVVRWLPEAGPVRVWVQPRPMTLAGAVAPTRAWRHAVLEGAAAWHALVPGLAFATAADSASADVHVVWGRLEAAAAGGRAAALDGARTAGATRPAGRTLLHAHPDGRAAGALVVLALEGESAPDSPEAVRLLARHEFGHVLGLAHHAAPRSVMAPVVVATQLAPEDRAALQLLYRLPPGAACAPPPVAGAGEDGATRAPDAIARTPR